MLEDHELIQESEHPEYEGRMAVSKLKVGDDLSRIFFELAGQVVEVFPSST